MSLSRNDGYFDVHKPVVRCLRCGLRRNYGYCTNCNHLDA
jgi:hypothetical protein